MGVGMGMGMGMTMAKVKTLPGAKVRMAMRKGAGFDCVMLRWSGEWLEAYESNTGNGGGSRVVTCMPKRKDKRLKMVKATDGDGKGIKLVVCHDHENELV